MRLLVISRKMKLMLRGPRLNKRTTSRLASGGVASHGWELLFGEARKLTARFSAHAGSLSVKSVTSVCALMDYSRKAFIAVDESRFHCLGFFDFRPGTANYFLKISFNPSRPTAPP
jgi:hypothetical protein